jgi:hypothetical protein
MNIDWSKSNEEILNELNEVVYIKTGNRLRFNDIENRFPDMGYRTMVIKSIDLMSSVNAEAKAVFIAAASDGTDLSDKYAQMQIKYIAEAGKWPQELTNFILSYCLWTGPRWKFMQLVEPTLDSIQKMRESHNVSISANQEFQRISQLRDKWQRFSNQVVDLISSGKLKEESLIEEISTLWV